MGYISLKVEGMEWDTSDDGMDGWTLMNIINHALHFTWNWHALNLGLSRRKRLIFIEL